MFVSLIGLGIMQAASASSPLPVFTLALVNPSDYRGSVLTLRAVNGAPCSIPASDAAKACAIDVPPDAETLTVEGELLQLDGRRQPGVRGSKTLRLLDLGPLLGPLRDWSRRLAISCVTVEWESYR